MNKNQLGLHSSSVCVYDGHLYCAFYACCMEGIDQRVYIMKRPVNEPGSWQLAHVFHEGTGNPVIFKFSGSLWVMMTEFRKEVNNDKISVHDKWAHTDTILYKLFGDEGAYVTGRPPEARETFCGCRCAPHYADQIVYLPCYDEQRHICQILAIQKHPFNPKDYMYFCRIGAFKSSKYPTIQPTIEQVSQGGIVISGLARVHMAPERHCNKALRFNVRNGQVSTVLSDLPNHNESLVAMPEFEAYVLNLYAGRKGLAISFLKHRDVIELCSPETHASYPNYCIDGDTVYICYTVREDEIKGFSTQRIRIDKYSQGFELKGSEMLSDQDL